MKKLIAVVIVLALVLAGVFWGWRRYRDGAAEVVYRTALVERGELAASIGATGTVEPEEVIDVGAQVAGQITEFGKDAQGTTVDYGSTVEEGMILARIDDSLYAMDVAQQQAAVDQAQAGMRRAEADLGQMKAKAEQAARDWERAQKLGPSDALSQASYDAYKSAYESAVATVKVGEAAIEQAKAAMESAMASLSRAKRNLGYTVIKSPVRGTVIDRRVNIGQTVVASLNAPSLFLLAKDLKRMQVWISVNEADIGQIHPGQKVTFTVDAYPGETFAGEVSKVRLNATMTQNVVTYTVEVTTDNSSGRLLPYLTANAQFEAGRREGVLMVPNAALRFSPSAQAKAQREAKEAAPAAATQVANVRPASAGNRGTVWVKNADGSVRAATVTTGLSDGIRTEIQGDGIQEGMEVVIAEGQPGTERAGGATSPFAPQFRRPGARH